MIVQAELCRRCTGPTVGPCDRDDHGAPLCMCCWLVDQGSPRTDPHAAARRSAA